MDEHRSKSNESASIDVQTGTIDPRCSRFVRSAGNPEWTQTFGGNARNASGNNKNRKVTISRGTTKMESTTGQIGSSKGRNRQRKRYGWGNATLQKERHGGRRVESGRSREREGERRSRRNLLRAKLSGKTNGLAWTEGFLLNDGMKWQAGFVVYVTSVARTVHPHLFVVGRPRT